MISHLTQMVIGNFYLTQTEQIPRLVIFHLTQIEQIFYLMWKRHKEALDVVLMRWNDEITRLRGGITSKRCTNRKHQVIGAKRKNLVYNVLCKSVPRRGTPTLAHEND